MNACCVVFEDEKHKRKEENYLDCDVVLDI